MKSALQAPDGGWGWVVVGGTALINVFNQSLLSMFGLIFGPTLQSIAGSVGVATVMSINCTISNFSGLIISPLSKYFSTKQITQIGVLLVSAGLALSAYTRSYTRITAGYGILTGLGFGLIASSTFLMINSYFSKKKSQAVGLSMAGTSIGQMTMPVVVALLIDHYSYDGTILILAGLSLHGLIGSMFFDPVSQHLSPKNRPLTGSSSGLCCFRNKNGAVENNNPEAGDASQTELEPKETFTNIKRRKVDVSSQGGADDDDGDQPQGTHHREDQLLSLESNEPDVEEAKSRSFCERFVALFDFHILLDPVFVHIMIGLSLAYTTSISFSTFFPLFLTIDLDMTVIDASACMSVLSFMDFVGRIAVPLLTNHLDITHRTTFIIGSFLLAVCRSVLVMQTTYTMIIIISGVCGLARAATVINQNLVIAEYSKQYVSSAVGLNMVSKGIFVLTIGTLLGEYKDSAHNYSGCIHILDVISLAVAVSWTLEMLYQKFFCRRSPL